MDVDLEVGIPATVILLPLGVLFVLWWISGASKRFFEQFKLAGEQWTEKAQVTHQVSEQVYKEEQVVQAGLQPVVMYSTEDKILNSQGVTANGIKISQYGTYGMTDTKQVIGL